MAETFPDDILCELVARGRLASHPPPTGLSGGNLDRRSDVRRSAWRAVDARGQELKLLLGRDLAACVSRQAKFSANAPALVAAPAFFEKVGPAEVIAEPYFAGGSLEARLAAHPSDAARLATAFVAVARHLARTEEPSTDAARRAEWDELAASVCAAEVWSATERDLLRQKILPALFPLVARDQPVTRWTNGDLTPENLLFDEHGALHLVDHEFARRTHFFAIDTVRLLTLSPIARAQPEFFSPHLPPAGPAWHLCFWLQQVAREARLNTAGYNERMRPRRLALIRRLAENLLDLPLDRWSEPAAAAPSHLEQAHWIADGNAGVRVAGWCHVAGARSRRVLVTQSDRTLAESPAIERPDVAAHLGPEAGQSGFELQFPVADADAPLVVSAVADDGSLLPFARLDPAELPGRGPAITGYVEWCATFDPDPPPPAVIPPAGPCFSILLPVYNTPSRLLRACLDSVLGQHYPHWELQLVDDASTESSVRECLREYARREDRLRLQERSTNGGIARATNDALHSASGEFVVLLDHDDVLRPHALLELARQILADPIADVLYSDEDKISEDGRILLPFLKPAFSPEFLRGVMYPGHVLCARTSLAREAGGFDSAYDGVQDYEFFLRLTERTQRITHVPRVLYHWRQSPGSSALVGNVKGDMDARQVAAVRAHLRRRGDPREPVALGGHRVRLTASTPPSFVTISMDGDPLSALVSAKNSSASVLVLVAPSITAADESGFRELAVVAALADSGLVAPVIVAREGRIHESGWTDGPEGPRPLMRGFDADGDGYNGSLRCTREVGAVSPTCVAIRTELVAAELANLPPETTWFELCRRLRQRGYFHRVCAMSRVRTNNSWRDPAAKYSPTEIADPFYNPHFDPSRGDYALARPPNHLAAAAALQWHLDVLPPARIEDGGVEVAGWCFHPSGAAVTIQVRAGEVSWSAICALPRPDVTTVHPAAGNCGFSVRIRVPRGEHLLEIIAHRPGQPAELLRRLPLIIPDATAVRRFLFASPARLLRFQLAAGPEHAPQAIPPENYPAVRSAAAPTPRIAVVTPSFNQAPFLARTMESVLRQDAAVDYFVQDGGSTDHSAQVIREVAAQFAARDDSRPQLRGWESAPDAGQADAIAKGFAKTTGGPDDLMAWINSDDFYLPGALRFVAEYFARHPHVDVAYGHRILVDEQSREVGRWFLPRHSDEILRLNDFVPQETLFWRRRIWDRVGGIDPSFKFAMDWDLLLRFADAGARIVRVRYFLACFRLHPAQKTSAAMHHYGQAEIDRLRHRAQGRDIPPAELESDPRLLRYLRRSALIEWLWSFGIRAP